MHIMVFLILQRKQVRYSSFIADVYICGLGTISCSSDAIMWKYVLFLNNVFHYRLFIRYSTICFTGSIVNVVLHNYIYQDPLATTSNTSSYVNGIELFVDGGVAQI